MRNFWTIPAVGVAVLASGCDNSQPTAPAKPIVVRSEAQNQLHQLDDMNRAIALKRAILDSGHRCKRVDSSGYVQEHGNLSMWTAKCDDGLDWGVFVGPDGSAQVRRCDDNEKLGLPACVVAKKGAPAAG